MKKITITQKDIEKEKIQFSPSGMLINELAYSSGEWTSEDLYDNNWEYAPREPYMFNFENDLFEATKTVKDYQKLIKDLNMSVGIKSAKTGGLQMGAYIALEHPEAWSELLEAYTEKLKEDQTEGISKAYNEALQKEQDSYHDDQYNEWLHGDRRDYKGIIRLIRDYFFDEAKAEYIPYDHKKKKEACFIFSVEPQELHNAYCGADLSASAESCKDCKKIDFKKELISSIKQAGEARNAKDKADRETRRIERERVAEYKKKRKEEEEAERKAKLLSMKLTK